MSTWRYTCTRNQSHSLIFAQGHTEWNRISCERYRSSGLLYHVRNCLAISKEFENRTSRTRRIESFCVLLQYLYADKSPFSYCSHSAIQAHRKHNHGPVSLTWVHRMCWIRTSLEIHDCTSFHPCRSIRKQIWPCHKNPVSSFEQIW